MLFKYRNVLQKLSSFQNLQNGRCLSTLQVMERENKHVAHNYHPLPVALVKGKGVFVWDVEGKRYYDCISGYAANSFGHCHPKIVNVLRDQAGILHHTSRAFYTDTLGEYAKFITSLFGYDKVLPMNTGVEADDTACKLSRKWGYYVKKIPENQAKIIFATGNFWGRSLAAVSSSTEPSCYKGYGPLMPGFNCVPYDDLKALEKTLNDPNVCAFMVEPIQGEAGVIVPSDGYLKGVRQLCTKYNVLWIADEIQTGLGRTGKRLAVDYEDVKPDILVLGKALSGGVYPVSACLANDNVMLVMEPGTHGSTFGGNALASKVALTSLRVLEEENLSQRAYIDGNIFRTHIENFAPKDILSCVRGRGLLNAIVLRKGTVNAYDVVLKLKENGIITKNTNDTVFRYCPPLVMTDEQTLETADIITKTLKEFC